MADSLIKQITSIRRRVRVLWLLHGCAFVLGLVLAMAIILGCVDYLVHIQDRGIRVFLTCGLIGGLGWAAHRYLWPAIGRRLTDVEIAQRIESRFPNLRDRLASAVQFLQEDTDDPASGSEQMRRAVVVAAEAQVEQYRLRGVIRTGPTIVAIATSAFVCVVALGLCIADPASARLAAARLVKPFGDEVWPQVHQLALERTIRQIEMGDAFEVRVLDQNGELPDEVRIYYRYDADTEQVESMRLDGSRMVARKDSVTRGFEYRVEGGDDLSMPWISLEVVEPPRIDSLQVTLTPPAYTGWPETKSEKFIRGLKGTRVAIRGTATLPLQSAILKRDSGDDLQLELSEDGYGFSLSVDAASPWVIDKSGQYWFELRNEGKLPGGTRSKWDVRTIVDRQPTINIERPPSNLYVTAKATVALKLLAKDDLAIRDVSLHVMRSDRSEKAATVTPLYRGPNKVAPLAAGEVDGQVPAGDKRHVEHEWKLAEMQLRPGIQLTFFATASDYQPAVGQSPSRRVTIITPLELEERIAQRQSFILGELSRVLKMQRRAREKTREVQQQLESIGRLRKQDIDQMQAAELTQRQVRRTLTSPSEGLAAQIAGLLEQLEMNRVDSPEMERRMRAMRDEIAKLEGKPLPAIERDLTGALKAAQDLLEVPARRKEIVDPLSSAGVGQDHVIASLAEMLGELSRFDSYRQFYRDISQLRRDQEDAEQTAKSIGRGTPEKQFRDGTFGKDFNQLTPQQQADLLKLANRQLELARRLERTLEGMDKMSGKLSADDLMAAATLSDALHVGRENQVSGRMREAGDQLRRNRVSQATQDQDKAGRAMQEMLDILQNRRENELSRLVKKLREAEAQLAKLRDRQAGLRKKIAAAAASPNEEQRRRELKRLAKQQQEIAEEARRMSRKLARLQAEAAGRSMSAAAGSMDRSGQAGQQGQGDAAGQQADTAEKDFEEAAKRLAKRRKQAEVDLAMEQLARLEDALVSLKQRQGKVVEETQRIESLRNGQRISRLVAGALRELAGQQKHLKIETDNLAGKMAAAEVFRLALDSAAKDMGRASALLERQRTSEETILAEKSAMRRFAQILESLRADRNAKAPAELNGDGPGGSGDANKIRSLAEIKLIRIMQVTLADRTKQLDELRRNEPLTPTQQAEYADLSQEQAQLADLVLNLVQAEDGSKDDIEAIPELDLDLPMD